MDKNKKKEITEFLNRKYSNINLTKLAKERAGTSDIFSVGLTKYAVESDKLNIFLVATNARKRAPVYFPVSNSIKRSLGITSIKTNVNLNKITGFCRDIITKKQYTFNLNKEERLLFKLESEKQSEYSLEKPKYKEYELKILEAKNYIKIILNGNKTSFYITKYGQGRIDEILGKLFGYPKCCIGAFTKRNAGLSHSAGKINKFTLKNIPEYMKYGLNSDFLPYIECSSKCKLSKNLVKSVHEYLDLLNVG
ncbi:DUF483 domain-containing protein [Candidatus Parvarchaeota archaeon]|nr:DUF483 domain-containing protein [Candidatus Parvarchaeota archaeon]